MKNISSYIAEAFEINEAAGEKDFKRVNDIVSKSKGSDAKVLQLSTNMANKITGKQKAIDRYEAAAEVLGNDHPAAQVFLQRAIDLGATNLENLLINGAADDELSVDDVLASRNAQMASVGKYLKYGEYFLAPSVDIGKYSPKTGKAGSISVANTYKGGIVYLAFSNETKVKFLVFDKSSKQSKVQLKDTRIALTNPGSDIIIGSPRPLADWCKVEHLDIMLDEHDITKPIDAYVIK